MTPSQEFENLEIAKRYSPVFEISLRYTPQAKTGNIKKLLITQRPISRINFRHEVTPVTQRTSSYKQITNYESSIGKEFNYAGYLKKKLKTTRAQNKKGSKKNKSFKKLNIRNVSDSRLPEISDRSYNSPEELAVKTTQLCQNKNSQVSRPENFPAVQIFPKTLNLPSKKFFLFPIQKHLFKNF